jgi:Ca2+-binding EF-hand superfamily protein
VDEIQLARYDRVFDGYANADGYLTRDCFTHHIRALAEIRGEPRDSPTVVAFEDELGNTWQQLASIADTDQDGRVSRDEWREAAQAITAALRHALETDTPSALDDWIETLYQVIDGNGDGHITKQEYTDWLSALGLAADTDIDTAFAGFDTNADGTLSKAEFTSLYHDFWSNFDPASPAHRWVGP